MKSSLTRTPVDPVRPVAGYVGGKRNLSARLVDMIEATDHGIYAEVCVGMGGVFLRRRSRPKMEVINDASADVATFFRVLQEHHVAFLDYMRFKLSSRHEFDRLMKQDPDTLTDIQRAGRFLYLQTLAFGGKVEGRNFGVSYGARPKFDMTRLTPLLVDLHDRLAGVLIERLDFQTFIERYDRPETLFFVDPPYWGSEGYYGKELFSKADFARLAQALKGVRGRFILTLNDVPEVRALFAWADIEGVELKYRLSGAPTLAREVIIKGGSGWT